MKEKIVLNLDSYNLEDAHKVIFDRLLKDKGHSTVETLAKELGINQRTVFRMFKKYKIDRTRTDEMKAIRLLEKRGFKVSK
jgi:Mn-dependent DtxR family transcriptional regulator